jgi:hypothetical protein
MPDPTGLTIDPEGYFALDGKRFVPVGVNYWPGSCGVEMWPRWPAAEIQHDLDVLASLGLNSVRFFLRWQDFEPEAGQYDRAMFERLAQFLAWCAERDLYAQPSLFVGWMSGGIFWPRWKGAHNAFGDPFMVERGTAFARQAASVIAPFHQHLLGIDQGNELCCLPDSRAASPQAVVGWCQAINEAIRSAYPHSLIVSGNEQNQIVDDSGWRFGAQPGTDYYSMHGYPVPTWHTVGFDGMTDPLCQSLLPFYTQVARAFGPVMVQEFGTIVTFGAQQQDSYLRAVLPACWEAGANGFLWWCLRDIAADVHPYLKHRFESTLGLVDARDRVKPGLEYFIAFARSLQLLCRSRLQRDKGAGDAIGIYWPRHYYPRENPQNPGNVPQQLSRWLVVANYSLRQLGYHTRVVRGDLPIAPDVHTILIPGALLDAHEVQALDAWVRAGNRLIWHAPDPVNWGYEYVRLLGAVPVDYRATRPKRSDAHVDVFGQTWALETYPRTMRVQVVPESATVLARDQDQLPVLLTNQAGQGTVVYALPVVEESIACVSGDRAERDRWQQWYGGILSSI